MAIEGGQWSRNPSSAYYLDEDAWFAWARVLGRNFLPGTFQTALRAHVVTAGELFGRTALGESQLTPSYAADVLRQLGGWYQTLQQLAAEGTGYEQQTIATTYQRAVQAFAAQGGIVGADGRLAHPEVLWDAAKRAAITFDAVATNEPYTYTLSEVGGEAGVRAVQLAKNAAPALAATAIGLMALVLGAVVLYKRL